MKRLFLAVPILVSLLFATQVWAYGGNHNFSSIVVATSDGHSVAGDYQAAGTFPYNGSGSYDRSKVDLRGTVHVAAQDGVLVDQSFCATLKGTINKGGGKVTFVRYTDVSCSQVAGSKSYVVVSYTESTTGDFTLVTRDGSGIVYTTSGNHQLAP
ncbi:MAG: hypothetical protein Q7S03_00080 [bacterium]|nr:hypothetical protein [bacterium]